MADVTPETLTDEMVRGLLGSTRSRDVQYLCRAWLQFGKDVMAAEHVAKLASAVNERAKRGGGR